MSVRALWCIFIVWLRVFGFQIFLRNGLLELVLGTTGAIIFSMYIIYDTHKIMEKVSPEEYIDASVNLYLDIINLFVSILRIFGEKTD
jgi:protein lifeguard